MNNSHGLWAYLNLNLSSVESTAHYYISVLGRERKNGWSPWQETLPSPQIIINFNLLISLDSTLKHYDNWNALPLTVELDLQTCCSSQKSSSNWCWLCFTSIHVWLYCGVEDQFWQSNKWPMNKIKYQKIKHFISLWISLFIESEWQRMNAIWCWLNIKY